MKIFRLFYIVVLCLFVVACSNRVYYYPIDNKVQMMFYNLGEPVVMIERDVVVYLQPYQEGGDKRRFVVMLNNKGDDVFDFSTENIKASLNGKNLKIFTYDELRNDIERSARIAKALTAMGGAMQSTSAGMSGGTTSHQGQFDYSGSSGSGSGSYYGTSTNQMQKQQQINAVNQNTQVQLSKIQSNFNAGLSSISTMLKRTTVFPDTTVGGIIVLEKYTCSSTRETKLQFEIEINEQSYNFDILCSNRVLERAN